MIAIRAESVGAEAPPTKADAKRFMLSFSTSGCAETKSLVGGASAPTLSDQPRPTCTGPNHRNATPTSHPPAQGDSLTCGNKRPHQWAGQTTQTTRSARAMAPP
ncbi:DUF6053 domain-containing protein [Lysobacter sp. CA199]|uniref:DUF6053 domain-containing protein n=1 Tax=Lysobacter sp. CA199 TaxID=3455608 RepID=UPI003F8D02CF